MKIIPMNKKSLKKVLTVIAVLSLVLIVTSPGVGDNPFFWLGITFLSVVTIAPFIALKLLSNDKTPLKIGLYNYALQFIFAWVFFNMWAIQLVPVTGPGIMITNYHKKKNDVERAYNNALQNTDEVYKLKDDWNYKFDYNVGIATAVYIKTGELQHIDFLFFIFGAAFYLFLTLFSTGIFFQPNLFQ